MNRLDNYLKEISPLLPRGQRQDILAEIEDGLRSQFEDRESELGRSLTDEEQEAILTRFGHAIIVAGRYQPQTGTLTFGRVLIGPELFPFYSRAVAIFVIGALVVSTIVHVAMGLANPANWDGVLGALFFYPALMFAVQTAIWIGLQKYFEAHPEKWKPKEKVARVSRFDSILQLLIQIAFMPAIVFLFTPGSPSAEVMLTRPWNNLYIPAVALAILSIGQALINLVKPEWVKLKTYSQFVSGLSVAAMCAYLLTSGPLIRINESAGGTAAKRAMGEATLHNFLAWSVGVTGIVVLAITLFEGRKLFAARSGRN